MRIASPKKYFDTLLVNKIKRATSKRCMFFLSTTSFCWDMSTQADMNYTIFRYVRSESGVEVVFCIICFQDLYFAMKLLKDHVVEGFKYADSFKIFSYEKYPCGSDVIVNENDKPPGPIYTFYF